MISKMEREGSQSWCSYQWFSIVYRRCRSGESDIRRWIIEQDLLECIVALPKDMFYNTGINTYLWFLTNKKAAHRKGKVQLINGNATETLE